MVQQLNAKGFNAKIVSVDTSTDPYENLKTALYEDRVFMYEYPILLQELRQLQRDFKRGKVDHPQRGSKDCSDAVAGVFWTLSQQQLYAPVPVIRNSAYGGDPWLPEQFQSAMGGNDYAAQSTDLDRYMPIPFLRGSGPMGGSWG